VTKDAGGPTKLIPSRDESESRRVAIVRRSDGYYEVRAERLETTWWDPKAPNASKWFPEGDTSGIYATEDLAEREAYAIYPWIRPSE
jgi:hypothetical protein